MATAIKHPVPDWVKPSIVILTSGHSDAQPWASECPDVKNYKWRLNPVRHRIAVPIMATMSVKGLKSLDNVVPADRLQDMSDEHEAWIRYRCGTMLLEGQSVVIYT